MKQCKTILLIILLLRCGLSLAQSSLGGRIINHYTVEQGLPNNIVYSTLCDRDGFVWFGTWYGLSRFDGTRFKNYTTAFSPFSDQPPRKIETIAEDGQGNIWIKTLDWKLYVFFKRQERFMLVFDQLKHLSHNLQIIKIQPICGGRIALLTKDKNLIAASTTAQGTVSLHLLANSRGYVDSSNNQLRRPIFVVTNKDAIWVDSAYHIFVEPTANRQWSKLQWRSYMQQKTHNVASSLPSISGQTVFDRSMSRDHVEWLGTGDGVYQIITPIPQFRLIPLPLEARDGVKALFQLRDGRILAGLRSKKLLVLDARGAILKTYDYAQYHIGSVYHIMEDHRHHLWLSTKGDGLVEAIPDGKDSWNFIHYKHDINDKTSLSGNNVYFTYEDRRLRIWVGTLDGGLNLMARQRGKTVFYNSHNGFTHYPGYGLYLEVRNMVEDRQGRMWVGTIDGLMSFDMRFRRPSDIRFSTCRRTRTSTLANTDVYNLYRDSHENIWMCTFGGGFSLLHASTDHPGQPSFTTYGTAEGLHNDVILSMTEDRQGRIWLCNGSAVSCFSPPKGRIRTFGSSEGFPNVEVEEASILTCQNGLIWIGTKSGILAFDPARLRANEGRLPVFIVGCRVNNADIRALHDPAPIHSAIEYADTITLRHDQRMFQLEFAGLSSLGNNRVIYDYRLEGYDEDWHHNGHSRIASYTNVPPGTYTFVVKATDAANPLHQGTRRLTLIILPPWWATWWAYTLYALLLLTAIYFAIRYAKYQIRLKNDLYVQSRLTEFKKQFYLQQQDKAFLERVKNFIDRHLEDDSFEIESIAKELGMSRSTFFKRMKSLTGMAPKDYVKERRLSHAVDLLKTTDLPIQDVAFHCGFSDTGYFGKCFRKRFGMTPREYQKEKKEAM